RRGKLRFAGNLCIAGIQWTARYAIVPLLLYSLGHPVNFLQFFILYWMLASLASFVPTPGATGAAEGAFLLVFGQFIPSATLGLAMIGWRFLSFYFLNIAGIVVLTILEIADRKKRPAPQTEPGPEPAEVEAA
ncbi:MAG TPA: YbhN family protein, partial [bacterium]|nr:YbhN family protein [bacterium]